MVDSLPVLGIFVIFISLYIFVNQSVIAFIIALGRATQGVDSLPVLGILEIFFSSYIFVPLI